MAVGIIGLGIMGTAYSANLLKAGIDVIGADPSEEARATLTAAGGVAHEATGAWVAGCDLIIISVASPKVLAGVASDLRDNLKPGQIVIESGTFTMDDKLATKEVVEANGAVLLDCPVSGTGAQAAKADLLIMASGPEKAVAYAKPYLAHLSHTILEAGEFGMGIKLKYVANHAVCLHNCAAAEALHYADAMGLDRDMVYGMLSNGAGQSKMLDLRMPLMMSGNYQPATANMSMFEKDISIIGADIRAYGITAPMFEAVRDMYEKTYSVVPPNHDAAAVFQGYRNADGKD